MRGRGIAGSMNPIMEMERDVAASAMYSAFEKEGARATIAVS
jgi:hypothetical protein